MSHVYNLESSNQEVNRVQTVLFLFLKKKPLLPIQAINSCVNKCDVNADILFQVSVRKCNKCH